ncbi:MAG: hypothetical protein JW743_08975, partial [Deltaproteobacteria bacterium]|nr:hypothetical protein [Deltaproteobacteria bacterium]
MFRDSRRFTNISLISIYFFLLFFALLVSGCSSSSSDTATNKALMSFSTEPFTYYSDGQGQNLDVYTERITISVADEKLSQLTEWLQTDPLILQPPEVEKLGRKNLVLVTLIEGANEEQIIDLIERLNASGLVEYATPVFGTEEEMTLISNEFIVRFLDTYSVSEIEAHITSQNVSIIERDFLWPKCYRLAFTSASGTNVMEVARTFYESGMVEFAHPDFITLTTPPWHTIAEEDFEGEFPKPGWSVYDLNPADGEYYWGKILLSDYFDDNWVRPEYNGDYLGWCSAGHAAGLTDRDPIENCPESYAPNMDAWLVVGPLDLSQAYWAQFKYWTVYPRLFDGEVELLASTDGETWSLFEPSTYFGFERGDTYALDNDGELGDLTGHDAVWIALRFVSDGETTTKSECQTGLFLDNILVQVSNLTAAEPITSDPLSALQWGLRNVGQSGGEAGW